MKWSKKYLRGSSAFPSYNKILASQNRAAALSKLRPGDYIGTILPLVAAPLPDEKK